MSLVELANSLGLLEVINIKETPGLINRNMYHLFQPKNQTFTYIIVIDFEATCWEKGQGKGISEKWKHLENEIIEFPAVLMRLQTGEILEEFHQYVMPAKWPQLSDFCIQLTGITQKQLDEHGVSLEMTIIRFNEWLKRCQTKYSLILPKTSVNNRIGNTAFVTWSDWDFGLCLKNEFKRKTYLKKPEYFNQWIDLRSIYKQRYSYKSQSFSDALTHLGMQFIGRPHSGIDDSRNTARLAHRMVKDGAILNITKDLKPFVIFIPEF